MPQITPDTESVTLQVYKGQLSLSMYENSGLLTIHIAEGRHLQSKEDTKSSYFIKVCLAPEDNQRRTYKTNTRQGAGDPVFNERLSFELLPGDMDKRILITAWDKNQKTRERTLLGSMSFGVGNICAKQKRDVLWYYLLSANIGNKKHLRVGRSQLGTSKEANVLPADTEGWCRSHKLSIQRGSRGFGFSISGFNPAYISRVEEGSHAHRVGLTVGDRVLHINGVNVYWSTTDAIARIIRSTDGTVNIEVERRPGPDQEVTEGHPTHTPKRRRRDVIARHRPSRISPYSRMETLNRLFASEKYTDSLLCGDMEFLRNR